MTRLEQPAYTKAKEYIEQNARPLEKVLFAYHFEGGSADAVLEALTTFQNRDGGFGHGLEPDVRLPDSSVIATTIAFQHFRELGLAGDHPLVVHACRFLVDTYDESHHNWQNVPPNVSDAPHAPWWTFKGEWTPVNPRAEIAGYLLDYPANFPEVMRQQVVEIVINHLLNHPDKMEMHDILCYQRFLETPSLSSEDRARIQNHLTRIIDHSVERDPAGWKEYGLPPLAVVSDPESPFAPMFEDSLEANLELIIDSQHESGGWMPNWTWGEESSSAWEQASREWSGVITLNNLRTLHAFGCLV